MTVDYDSPLKFDWADGTALIPNSKEADPVAILSSGSDIQLSSGDGFTTINIKLKLDEAGDDGKQLLEFSDSYENNQFPIGDIDLDPGNCGESSDCLFTSGSFQGRYVGSNAEAIMSLIRADENVDGDADGLVYRGIGVFKNGRYSKDIGIVDNPDPR